MLALLCVPLAAAAIDVAPGVPLRGEIRFPDAGVTITLPAGWEGAWDPQDDVMRVSAPGDPGRVFVTVAAPGSASDLGASLALPLAALSETGLLVPVGSGLQSGGFSLMAYEVAGQPDTKGMAIARPGPDGAGVASYAVGPVADEMRYWNVLKDIGQSATFAVPSPRPAAPAIADAPRVEGGGDDGEWSRRLAGRRLWPIAAAVGPEKTLDLCLDGTFRLADAPGGTWTLRGADLTLRHADGRVEKSALRSTGSAIFHGEVPYSLTGEPAACP